MLRSSATLKMNQALVDLFFQLKMDQSNQSHQTREKFGTTNQIKIILHIMRASCVTLKCDAKLRKI